MSNINKMISAAAESDPSTFHKAFTAEVHSRIGSAIESQRAVVVSKMFGIQEAVDEEDCDCEDDDKKDEKQPNDDDDVAESILAMSESKLNETFSDFTEEDLDTLSENLINMAAAPFKNAAEKINKWRGQRKTNKRMKHVRSFRKPRAAV